MTLAVIPAKAGLRRPKAGANIAKQWPEEPAPECFSRGASAASNPVTFALTVKSIVISTLAGITIEIL